MRQVLGVMAVALLLAAPALGADKAELRKQLNDVNNEIRAAEEKAKKDPKYADQVKAVADAQKALDKACSDIPEIKEVDTKLADARKKAMDLQKERQTLMGKHKDDEALKAPKQALADAMAALSKGDKNDKEKYTELQKAVGDAQKALQKVYSDIPDIKAVDEKMAEPRKLVTDLMTQRMDLVKKNADNEAVKKAKTALDEAKGALQKALADAPGMKELLDKKADLEKQLKAAETTRPPKKEGGEPKATRVPKAPKVPAGGVGAGNGVG